MNRKTFVIIIVLIVTILATPYFSGDASARKKRKTAYELGTQGANCDTRADCHLYIEQPGNFPNDSLELIRTTSSEYVTAARQAAVATYESTFDCPR